MIFFTKGSKSKIIFFGGWGVGGGGGGGGARIRKIFFTKTPN